MEVTRHQVKYPKNTPGPHMPGLEYHIRNSSSTIATLPETNSQSPLKIGNRLHSRERSYSNHPFSGVKLAVSFREGKTQCHGTKKHVNKHFFPPSIWKSTCPTSLHEEL